MLWPMLFYCQLFFKNVKPDISYLRANVKLTDENNLMITLIEKAYGCLIIFFVNFSGVMKWLLIDFEFSRNISFSTNNTLYQRYKNEISGYRLGHRGILFANSYVNGWHLIKCSSPISTFIVGSDSSFPWSQYFQPFLVGTSSDSSAQTCANLAFSLGCITQSLSELKKR